MKSIWNKAIAAMTLFNFSLVAAVPAAAQDTIFTQKFLEAKAAQFNAAPRDKGVGPFVEAYLPELSKQDKESLRKVAQGAPGDVKMKVLGANRIALVGGGKNITVEMKIVSEGALLTINGKEVRYVSSKSIADNYAAIEKVLGAKEVSLFNLLIPEANAFLSEGWCIGIGILGALLIGVAAYGLGRNGTTADLHAPVRFRDGAPVHQLPVTIESGK